MSRARLSSEIIEKVIELRRDKDMTQEEISLVLGIGRSTVAKYLNPTNYRLRQNSRYNGGYVHTTVSGKHGKFKVRKRPRPNSCELCEKSPVLQWYWHHWDDTCLEYGLWLCWTCHNFVEGLEKGGLNASHIEKYFNLKETFKPS